MARTVKARQLPIHFHRQQSLNIVELVQNIRASPRLHPLFALVVSLLESINSTASINEQYLKSWSVRNQLKVSYQLDKFLASTEIGLSPPKAPASRQNSQAMYRHYVTIGSVCNIWWDKGQWPSILIPQPTMLFRRQVIC